jgi:hypothetical protein
MKKCLNCRKELVGHYGWGQLKYCSTDCQRQYQYVTFIDKWKKGKIDGGRAGGYVSHHVARYLKETYGNRCSLCGWDKVNPFTGKVPLVKDHKDGNCLNNSPDNVRLICSNCDSLTATYKGANKGKGRVSRGVHLSFKPPKHR